MGRSNLSMVPLWLTNSPDLLIIDRCLHKLLCWPIQESSAIKHLEMYVVSLKGKPHP